jgi:hypothetical protein
MLHPDAITPSRISVTVPSVSPQPVIVADRNLVLAAEGNDLVVSVLLCDGTGNFRASYLMSSIAQQGLMYAQHFGARRWSGRFGSIQLR